MLIRGSGWCALKLLARPMGTVHSQALISCGPGPAPTTPRVAAGSWWPACGGSPSPSSLSCGTSWPFCPSWVSALRLLGGSTLFSEKSSRSVQCCSVCWAFLVLFHDSSCLVNILQTANWTSSPRERLLLAPVTCVSSVLRDPDTLPCCLSPHPLPSRVKRRHVALGF